MKRYKCEICGKNHNFYYRYEAPIPEVIRSISDRERDDRIKSFNRFQFLDKERVFVNGTISIEIIESELCLGWIVWIEISRKEFLRVMREYEKGNFEARFKGRMAEDVFFYEESKDISIEYTHGEEVSNSVIRVTDQSHQLGKDQENGISDNQLMSLMNMIHHPELERGEKIFNESFHERMIKELEEVSSEFIKNERDFAINISNSRVTLFQIISRRLLESTKDSEFGYGLHLSFDETNEDCTIQIDTFRELGYDEDFDFHNLDGIPTYQKDLNQDKLSLIEIVESLLKNVYEEEEIEKIGLDNFEI